MRSRFLWLASVCLSVCQSRRRSLDDAAVGELLQKTSVATRDSVYGTGNGKKKEGRHTHTGRVKKGMNGTYRRRVPNGNNPSRRYGDA